MADVKSHYRISTKVRERLEEKRVGEQYAFIQLGNWLTDYSQFRDPTAYISAKITVWQSARDGNWALKLPFLEDVLRFDTYLDDLFGVPGEEPRGGAVSEYLRELFLAACIEKFRRPPLSLDPAEIERIYNARYTQYYPHEHLDFAPGPQAQVRGDDSPSNSPVHSCGGSPAVGVRKLLRYLEDDLEHTANLLSDVERRWTAAAGKPATDPELHDLLAQYGHASHLLEDFFVHSNFIDLGWRALKQELPKEPIPEGASENPDDYGPARLERILFRRCRAPLFDGDGRLSETSSKPAEHVFTGFFGAHDVKHTLVDGLNVIRDDLARSPSPKNDVVLQIIDGLASTDPERQKKQLADYKAMVLNPDRTELALAASDLDERSRAALRRGLAIDRRMISEYGLGGRRLGIYGMIQQIATIAQEAEHASDEARRKLDTKDIRDDDRSHIPGEPPDSVGAASEDIGSHSLVAKDSVRALPLHEAAVAVAMCAALHVAERMADRVPRDAAQPDGALDWQEILRHFISHPSEAEGAAADAPWWLKAAQAAPDTPGYEEAPTFCKVDSRVAEPEAARRSQLPTQGRLRRMYTDLEAFHERRWRSEVDQQFVSDAAVIGLLGGGITGGILGWGKKRPLSCIVGIGVGILFGVLCLTIPVALGLLVAGPLAWIGLLLGMAAAWFSISAGVEALLA